MSRRTDMLGSMIQRELAVMIQRDLQDPRLTGFPSVTRVQVSPDLSIAKVFVTVMGSAGQQTAALNALKHSAGLMRSKLTKSLTLRQAPFLNFELDEELKKELEVLDLIQKANREIEEREAAKRAAENPELVAETSEAQSEGAPPAQNEV